MAKNQKNTLCVETKEITNGISIKVEGKEFKIEYPDNIWQETPKSIQQVLVENLAFGETFFLPLVLDKKKIIYNTQLPLFEPFWFKNQIYDLFDCEQEDKVKHLSYFKQFYNLDFKFALGDSILPKSKEIPELKTDQPTAIIPFSFGKESLTTFAICKELGVKPVLVYCQEPEHPYESEYKTKKIAELKKEFQVSVYVIKNDPGFFRYGLAFGKKLGTELGWGTETTLLSLLMVPFIFKHKARYIFFGNEFSTNKFILKNGWKSFYSFDQTTEWSKQQNNMIRLLTDNQCHVKNILEPLEQITVFHLLYHRYKNISKYHSSCFGQKPLLKNSKWCHQCFKCEKTYLLAKIYGFDPKTFGFKYDLQNNKNFIKEYFEGYDDNDTDFIFYILSKKGEKTKIIKKFIKEKIGKIQSWQKLYDFFTHLKSSENLPDEYQKKLLNIFNQELKEFIKILPK